MNHQESLHDNDMLEVSDEFGLKIRVPRSEYLHKILPHNIQLQWDNPDELASIIINALHDEIYLEVEKAAKRLLEIDNVKERAASLYGSVLLKMERYLEAENFFQDYLSTNLPHPYVLTNFAKSQDLLGKNAEAIKTLEESLKIDSNQDNALNWWVQIKKDDLEKQDLPSETALIYALEQAKIRFGGWLVKVLLGVEYLKINDKEEAHNNFTDVLQVDKKEYNLVLEMLSSEIGRNGFPQDLVDLLAPIYTPAENHILTGLNLLQAYYELRDVVTGQKLLESLYKVGDHHFAEQLSWYEREFVKLNTVDEASPQENIESVVITIDYPMWCYGWNIRHDFDISQNGKKIAILQFACDSDQKMFEVTAELDTDQTKLARALPLSILENLYYSSDIRAAVMLPICEDRGNSHMIFNSQPENQQIMELVNQGYSAAVTGTIIQDKLQLSYWDVQKISKNDAEFKIDRNSLKDLPLLLVEFVATQAGVELSKDFKQDKRGFTNIVDSCAHDYLLLSAQHMTLHIANNFTNLHDLIRGMLKIAKESQNIQIQLSMLSIIHLAVRHEYSEIKDYRGIICKWLEQVSASGNPLNKMAVQTSNMFARYCQSNF